jgi:O-antigen ligase
MLTFIAVVLLQILISPVFKKWGALLAVGSLLVASLWFFLIGYQQIQGWGLAQRQRIETISNLLQGKATEVDTGSRLELATIGLGLVAQRPLIGYGIGTMHRMPGGGGYAVHNTFLLVAGDSGIIPLGLFVAFFATMFYTAWRCPVVPIRVLVASYVVVAVMDCMAGHSYLYHREHNAMLGICIGAMAAVAEMRRQQVRAARAAVLAHG